MSALWGGHNKKLEAMVSERTSSQVIEKRETFNVE